MYNLWEWLKILTHATNVQRREKIYSKHIVVFILLQYVFDLQIKIGLY